MILKNRIIKHELIEWKTLKWFQPEELKDITKEQFKKLKNSLLQNGVMMPFTVWEFEDLYCLDGHMRLLAMESIEKDGHEIPEMFPANFIECEDEAEAIKIVLIFNSHYAKINEGGLKVWTGGMNLEELDNEIEIPNISKWNFSKDELSFEIIETDNVNNKTIANCIYVFAAIDLKYLNKINKTLNDLEAQSLIFDTRIRNR